MFKILQIHKVSWWGIFPAWSSACVIKMLFWNFIFSIINKVLSLMEKFKLISNVYFPKLRAVIS